MKPIVLITRVWTNERGCWNEAGVIRHARMRWCSVVLCVSHVWSWAAVLSRDSRCSLSCQTCRGRGVGGDSVLDTCACADLDLSSGIEGIFQWADSLHWEMVLGVFVFYFKTGLWFTGDCTEKPLPFLFPILDVFVCVHTVCVLCWCLRLKVFTFQGNVQDIQ